MSGSPQHEGVRVRTLRFRPETAPPRGFAPASSIVFPRFPVRIRHRDEVPFVADSTVAVVYRRSVEFDRECLAPEGVASDWLELPDDLCGDLLQAKFRGGRSHVIVRCAMSAMLLERLMLDDIAAGGDPLCVEEGALLLLERLLSTRPLPTNGPHVQLANDTKALIAREPTSAASLCDLAAGLGVSPFHLCRVFAANLGTTMTRYRDQLRMRLAVDELAAGAPDVPALARRLGYADPRVFRRRFRRLTGLSVAEALRRTTYGKGAAIRAAVFRTCSDALD